MPYACCTFRVYAGGFSARWYTAVLEGDAAQFGRALRVAPRRSATRIEARFSGRSSDRLDPFYRRAGRWLDLDPDQLGEPHAGPAVHSIVVLPLAPQNVEP